VAVYFPRIEISAENGGVFAGPSGTIAALMAQNDLSSDFADAGLEYTLSDSALEELAHPSNKRTINAIRSTSPQRLRVVGNYTQDPTDPSFALVSTVLTVQMIEHSIHAGLSQFSTSTNTSSTWDEVRVALNDFLAQLWKANILKGDRPSQSFWVQIGLGTTMTQQDILNEILRANIAVAIDSIDGLLVITFSQEMHPAPFPK
jgi:phage tail sheath protein FI